MLPRELIIISVLKITKRYVSNAIVSQNLGSVRSLNVLIPFNWIKPPFFCLLNGVFLSYQIFFSSGSYRPSFLRIFTLFFVFMKSLSKFPVSLRLWRQSFISGWVTDYIRFRFLFQKVKIVSNIKRQTSSPWYWLQFER